MHSAAVRPYINAGVALVGASVIAAAPLAPAPPHIALPTVRSAEVALTATAGALDAYAQLVNHTFTNVGTLTHQTFQNGVAPLLTQFLKNQLTLVQGLGAAAEQALQISNPSSVPALLQKALGEIAAGQFQAASETIATGVIQVAFPFLPSLLTPLNNLVAVVNQLPNIALVGSLAVIQPPLALVQATGQAVQGIADALAAGDLSRVVNAIVSAPAVMVDGFLNGYSPTQTGGLLTPGLGTLSLLVNIRDMIVTAITPAAAAATTDAVTSTKTTAAKVVTLDVAPQQDAGTKADTSTEATTGTAVTEGQAADAKNAAATDGTEAAATKGDTSGKTTTPAADETGSPTETSTNDSAAEGDTAAKGDTTTKGDTATKSDAKSKGDATAKDSSATKVDSGATKASEKKKDSDAGEKADTAKADNK
jgi:hypothetical protein